MSTAQTNPPQFVVMFAGLPVRFLNKIEGRRVYETTSLANANKFTKVIDAIRMANQSQMKGFSVGEFVP